MPPTAQSMQLGIKGMHYSVRREDRKMDDEAALSLLSRCTWGVLSTVGPDGAPYGTPLNYVLDARASQKYLILHASIEGRKLDNLRQNPRASFVAVEEAEVLPDKFSTAYASAIVEGTVEIVEDPETKRDYLRCIVAALAPAFQERGDKHIENYLQKCCVLKLAIESLCGKRRQK